MYRATVLSTNTDGSIKVQCPALYGDNQSGNIPAAIGTVTPPIGTVVWISLENDDHNKPIWLPFEIGELTASGVTPGTYGDSTHTGQFTVTGSGLITAAANIPRTPVGIIVSGSTISPSTNQTMPLSTVISGASSWLSSNTITIPTGAGGLYQIAYSVVHNNTNVAYVGVELRNASGTPYGINSGWTGVVGTSLSSYANASGIAQVADGATFRIVWVATTTTGGASVSRFSIYRIGDSLSN